MIQFQEVAILYLDELIEVLYKKEYFGFIESAEIYVSRIYDFVEENIQNFPKRKTPLKLKRFGNNYIFFKINLRTTWYIFFEEQNNIFLITYILNNHCAEAKYL